jgi:hypothetical protein
VEDHAAGQQPIEQIDQSDVLARLNLR